MRQRLAGLGDQNYRVAVCIGNCPMMPEYQTLTALTALEKGNIAHITEITGNHWRKVFNIFAKLMFQLDESAELTWQDYRDLTLLQKGCGHALIFSSLETLPSLGQTLTIIAGKTHAQALGVFESVSPLGEGFYIDASAKIIVTPYFDYRQLSNRKLDMLISLIKGDFKPKC